MITDNELQQHLKGLFTFAEILMISLHEEYPKYCKKIRIIIHQLIVDRISLSKQLLNSTKQKLKAVVGARYWEAVVELLKRDRNHGKRRRKKFEIKFRMLKSQKHRIEFSKKENTRKHIGEGLDEKYVKEDRVFDTLYNSRKFNLVKIGGDKIEKYTLSQISCMK